MLATGLMKNNNIYSVFISLHIFRYLILLPILLILVIAALKFFCCHLEEHLRFHTECFPLWSQRRGVHCLLRSSFTSRRSCCPQKTTRRRETWRRRNEERGGNKERRKRGERKWRERRKRGEEETRNAAFETNWTVGIFMFSMSLSFTQKRWFVLSEAADQYLLYWR